MNLDGHPKLEWARVVRRGPGTTNDTNTPDAAVFRIHVLHLAENMSFEDHIVIVLDRPFNGENHGYNVDGS